MLLGTMNIEENVSGDHDSTIELLKKTAELMKGCYSGERLVYQKELIRRTKKIDIGFLEFTQKHGNILVPRFGCFRIIDDCHIDNCTFRLKAYPYNDELNISFSTPRCIFEEAFIKAIEKNDFSKKHRREYYGGTVGIQGISNLVLTNMSEYLRNTLGGNNNGVLFSSNFNGLIPQQTKEKIETARSIFDDVYIIAEANWQTTVIQADPLVVGVAEDGEVALIDHFNTTPIEKYIEKEFTT